MANSSTLICNISSDVWKDGVGLKFYPKKNLQLLALVCQAFKKLSDELIAWQAKEAFNTIPENVVQLFSGQADFFEKERMVFFTNLYHSQLARVPHREYLCYFHFEPIVQPQKIQAKICFLAHKIKPRLTVDEKGNHYDEHNKKIGIVIEENICNKSFIFEDKKISHSTKKLDFDKCCDHWIEDKAVHALYLGLCDNGWNLYHSFLNADFT